ncbi:hypothetical protein AXG93_684s1040 [Marchantia polymorpha subsp. ruderalis]|uniref:Uncharacterized protein n=1 Tax=Marchantia polymorpha subsp. ruderalis TaxID=1480154 RepID=A0A176W9P0_MARPO|nr:hypothetical protein AXG93_684s1040 [Marchantia polymorpha subsp. ruderalis]
MVVFLELSLPELVLCPASGGAPEETCDLNQVHVTQREHAHVLSLLDLQERCGRPFVRHRRHASDPVGCKSYKSISEFYSTLIVTQSMAPYSPVAELQKASADFAGQAGLGSSRIDFTDVITVVGGKLGRLDLPALSPLTAN